MRLSSLRSSSFHFENNETCADDEEYIPVLSFRQHDLDNVESDEYDDEDEEENAMEINTRSVRKRKRKPAGAVQRELPPPPDFEPLVQSPFRRAKIRLPPHFDVGVSKPVDFFFFFLWTI